MTVSASAGPANGMAAISAPGARWDQGAAALRTPHEAPRTQPQVSRQLGAGGGKRGVQRAVRSLGEIVVAISSFRVFWK